MRVSQGYVANTDHDIGQIREILPEVFDRSDGDECTVTNEVDSCNESQFSLKPGIVLITRLQESNLLSGSLSHPKCIAHISFLLI